MVSVFGPGSPGGVDRLRLVWTTTRRSALLLVDLVVEVFRQGVIWRESAANSRKTRQSLAEQVRVVVLNKKKSACSLTKNVTSTLLASEIITPSATKLILTSRR